MKKIIVITGTPGTGKSTLAKLLTQKLKLPRLDLHHYYQQLSVKYNTQKKCYDLDYAKFEKLVQQKLQNHPNGLILDSHVAHHLPKKLVKLCIVLTCSNLKILERRLKQRKYPAQKTKENLQAEIFQTCLLEAQQQGHNLIVFDTSTLAAAIIVKKLLQKIKP